MNLKRIHVIYLFALVFISVFSCNSPQKTADTPKLVKKSNGRVIVVQPFEHFPSAKAAAIFKKIKLINPNALLYPAMPLPPNSFYPERKRYRADYLIKFLSLYVNTDTVIIGLTDRDISATKGKIKDWGIMGLGYQPGNACVVSTFRLAGTNQSSQLYKLVLHELGHTQGLPHCPNPTCLMRDAEGGNHLDEETDFCPSCKEFLQRNGWHLK